MPFARIPKTENLKLTNTWQRKQTKILFYQHRHGQENSQCHLHRGIIACLLAYLHWEPEATPFGSLVLHRRSFLNVQLVHKTFQQPLFTKCHSLCLRACLYSGLCPYSDKDNKANESEYSTIVPLQLCEYSHNTNTVTVMYCGLQGRISPPFLLLLFRAAVALLPLCTLAATAIQI